MDSWPSHLILRPDLDSRTPGAAAMPAGLLKSWLTFFKSKCFLALNLPSAVVDAEGSTFVPLLSEEANMRLSQGFDFCSEFESESVSDSGLVLSVVVVVVVLLEKVDCSSLWLQQ